MTDLKTLLAAFNASEWRSHFDAKTLARAADSVRRGHVLAYEFETHNDEGALIGRVRDAAAPPHKCGVEYFPTRPQQRFDSYCSCSRETWCTHVAALLQHALQHARTASAMPLTPAAKKPWAQSAAQGKAVAAAQRAATVVVSESTATQNGKPRELHAVPIPVIVLRSIAGSISAGHETGSSEIGCAKLAFEYEGVRLRFPPVAHHERVQRAGELLDIEHDRSAEFATCEYLYELGLREAHTCHQLPRQMLSAIGEDDWLLPNNVGVGAPAQFLHLLPHLQAQGFRVEYDPSFPVEVVASPDVWYGQVTEQGEAWFDLELGVEVNGERIPLLPILQGALLKRSFPMTPARNEAKNAVWLAPLDDRRRIPLPLKRIRALLAPLLEWLESRPLKATGSLRLSRAHSAVVAELDSGAAELRWRGSREAHNFAKRLHNSANAGAAPVPAGFNAELRPYQRDGLAWLNFLGQSRLGGILADDMGLGKTVQLLAHLLSEKLAGRLEKPALVVIPTSLIYNWKIEAARFAPDLRVLVLHGPDREARFAKTQAHDLVITTYPLLPRDRESLMKQQFSVLVLDEAQTIKNPRSQAARVAREINAAYRIAMTGTPLENHLGELWAELDCVLPGLLGDERRFVRNYRVPIEKHGDAEVQARLNRRIAPFMLRRTKEQVAHELPAKTVITRTIEITGRQRDLYQTLSLTMHDKVRSALRKYGAARSGIVVLDALLKLRQVCCDPRLVKLETGRNVQESAKLEFLLPMIEELLVEGRRILLFSQFTEMLDLIAQSLDERGIEYVTLTGKTRNRAAPIERFQRGAVPLFLISLKAGGVGLNLTAADTVIHYDPWWNPAAESQATDRAHRIGQDKAVFVYKLICSGTVEEKIQILQQRKADLANAVLEGGTSQKIQFAEEDIDALFDMDGI